MSILNIVANKNAYTDDSAKSTNFHDEPLWCFNSFIEDLYEDVICVLFLQHNVSGASELSGAIILDSQIKIYNMSGSAYDPPYFSVYKCSASWVETTITWNNMPFSTANPIVEHVDIDTSSSGYRYFEVPKAIVTGWRDGTNNGYLIDADSHYYENFLEVADRLNGTVANRPTLIVVYVAKPTNLGATAISSSRIDLAWDDNADNEDGYKIERKTGAGGTYAQIDTVGAGVSTYEDTTCSPSTEYYYRVRGYLGAENTGYSNEDNATTPSDVTGPSISIRSAEMPGFGIGFGF